MKKKQRSNDNISQLVDTQLESYSPISQLMILRAIRERREFEAEMEKRAHELFNFLPYEKVKWSREAKNWMLPKHIVYAQFGFYPPEDWKRLNWLRNVLHKIGVVEILQGDLRLNYLAGLQLKKPSP